MQYLVVKDDPTSPTVPQRSQTAPNQPMSEVTQILDQIQRGDPAAAADLLPLVYRELRQLARHRLSKEKAGQTLQPTALVHEAYLRLMGDAS